MDNVYNDTEFKANGSKEKSFRNRFYLTDKEISTLSFKVKYSPFYSTLQKKHDIFYDETAEVLNQQITSTSGAIANDLCDRSITEFLSTASSLAAIEGGEFTLSKVNELIPNPAQRISYTDLFRRNVLKVFDDRDKDFQNLLIEYLSRIFDGKSDIAEVNAVRLAYELHLIAQYMRVQYNWDYVKASDFIFDELMKIKKKAKATGNFELSPDITRTVETIKEYFGKKAVDYDMSFIESLIGRYLSSEITKEELLDELLSYSPKKKVKE